MEATGRDGGAGGPSWSYRRHHEEIGSSSYTISSSSRSGTIVSSSTAYTSGASAVSSGIHMEAALQLDLELELMSATPEPDKMDAEFAQRIKKPRTLTKETLKEMRMKRIKSMVQQFLDGSGGGMSSLHSWFLELGVSWVLQLDVGASSWTPEHFTSIDKTQNWIQALTQITEYIHLMECFFPDHGHGFVGMPSSEEEVDSRKGVDPLHFALFFQEAMSKMLVFVDVMFTKSISIHGPVHFKSSLKVNIALSEVLLGFRLQFPAEVEKIEEEMVSLLSAKLGKAFDAIWSFIEERRTCALKSMEDSLGTETPQGSSDIHQATCSVVDHIQFLLYDCWAVDPLFVYQAASLGKYVPQTGLEQAEPFVSMISEMVSCLEEKLITKSRSFLDKVLGLLFLLNNSNFIREQLQNCLSYIEVDLTAVITRITHRVEHYTESYIQVSWEPVLACLFNPTPPLLVRKYSPLSKFESEFQKIYTTQKLWKVPDPELRNRLRKAIIEKIIPGYTKYIEDSKVTNPKFTPQELEEKLQDLFEG